MIDEFPSYRNLTEEQIIELYVLDFIMNYYQFIDQNKATSAINKMVQKQQEKERKQAELKAKNKARVNSRRG